MKHDPSISSVNHFAIAPARRPVHLLAASIPLRADSPACREDRLGASLASVGRSNGGAALQQA